MGEIQNEIRPAIRSVTACEPTRYGTWMTSMPVNRLNSSPLRCPGVPFPADPNINSPGRRFASATNSGSVFAGSTLLTDSTAPDVPSSAIGARSLTGSKFSFG